MSDKPQRAYPLPRSDDDDRVEGLAADVAEVLVRHGYPEITSGRDFVDLEVALYRFLYEPIEGAK